MSLNRRKVFRELLRTQRTIMAPAAHDGVSARIIEAVGFDVVYASGMAMAASRLGVPDIGLISMAEVVDHAANISEAVNVPVLADADNGYGNVNNVYRTVRIFEKAGLAGIHLEDQVMPKKCGLMTGRGLISAEEMVGKIKVALAAREDKDFVIIARSDARGVNGYEEAKRRLQLYLEAGADLAMVGEHYSISELKDVAESLPGKLLICGGNPGMEETSLAFSEYESWGVKVIIYPHLGLYSAARAIRDIYSELKKEGYLTQERITHLCYGFDDFQKLLGLPKWNAREKKYSS